jgi:Ser/Thr protein kinase RdoA (MazF antagonist)
MREICVLRCDDGSSSGHQTAEEDEQHWGRIEAFVAGYGSVAQLTQEEIARLPLCLRLRRMITFLYRMAQHWDGCASAADGTFVPPVEEKTTA